MIGDDMARGLTTPCSTSHVAVVIPHYERLADTAACCAALATQTHRPAAILVVDNASSSHTDTELAEACPAARVLRLERNRGFAGGVNAGIREALAMPIVDFVWVLNNDTLCAPETLARLVACAASEDDIGLVGCPLLEGHEAARRRTVPAGKNLLWPWGVPVPAAPDETPDYLSGASLLIRRALLDDIGLFDEGFFFFFEDADLSLRAKEHGWQLCVARDAVVTHTGSATIRGLSEMQARCYRTGHVRFLRMHRRHPLLRAVVPFLFRLACDAANMNGSALRGNMAGWRAGWMTPVPPPSSPPPDASP